MTTVDHNAVTHRLAYVQSHTHTDTRNRIYGQRCYLAAGDGRNAIGSHKSATVRAINKGGEN